MKSVRGENVVHVSMMHDSGLCFEEQMFMVVGSLEMRDNAVKVFSNGSARRPSNLSNTAQL